MAHEIDNASIKGSEDKNWFLPTVGIIVALVIACSVGGLAGQQVERERGVRRYYQGTGKAIVRRHCRDTQPTKMFDCVSEAFEHSNEGQRSARELFAQQQAAWAGIFSAVWSLCGLIATLVGLYWIKGTLEATRLSAEAARDAVVEAKRIGEAQSRSYVDFHGIKIIKKAGLVDLIEVVVHNFGQTPAIDVVIRYSYDFFMRNTLSSGQLERTGSLGILAPGDESKLYISLALDEHGTKALDVGQLVVFADLRVEYSDVYKQSHFIKATYFSAREGNFAVKAGTRAAE